MKLFKLTLGMTAIVLMFVSRTAFFAYIGVLTAIAYNCPKFKSFIMNK